jgi:hypothetical protein
MMSLKERIRLYERQAGILESIAKRYPRKSAEYVAIRQAAIALWYGLTRQQSDFLEYMEKREHGELTGAQKEHLKSMGIDPQAEPPRRSSPRSSRGRKRR